MRFCTAALALVLEACAPADATFEPPDLDFNRMLEQPRYEAYAMSTWFDDRSVMRHPPEGTVPFVGADPLEDAAPQVVDRATLAHGRDRFQRVCAACHGIVGNGNPPVADRMELRPPPSLHTDKARSFSDEMLLKIVREGYGLMPSYENMLDREDRLAVVAYLRALQLSQHAVVSELPPDVRRRLEEVAEP